MISGLQDLTIFEHFRNYFEIIFTLDASMAHGHDPWAIGHGP